MSEEQETLTKVETEYKAPQLGAEDKELQLGETAPPEESNSIPDKNVAAEKPLENRNDVVQVEMPSHEAETKVDVTEKQSEQPTDVTIETRVEQPAENVSGDMENEEKKKEKECLQLNLEELALKTQENEREAYMKLTEEHSLLQKHHDEMKTKYEKMEADHAHLSAELGSLKEANKQQMDTIAKLEVDIKALNENQGGDDTIKDLREKLTKLSKELEDKDEKIYSLVDEIGGMQKKLKDAESCIGSGDLQKDPRKSHICSTM